MVTASETLERDPLKVRFALWFKNKTAFDYLLIIILTLLAAITILPFMNIIAISFSGEFQCGGVRNHRFS